MPVVGARVLPAVKIEAGVEVMDESGTAGLPSLAARGGGAAGYGAGHVRDEVRVEEVRDEEMKGELHVFDEFRDVEACRSTERIERRWAADGRITFEPVGVGCRGVRWRDTRRDGEKVRMTRLPLLLQRTAPRSRPVAGGVFAREAVHKLAPAAAAAAAVSGLQPLEERAHVMRVGGSE
jgi:hypothetical protein